VEKVPGPAPGFALFFGGNGEVLQFDSALGTASPWLANGSPIEAAIPGVTASALGETGFLYLATGDGDDALWRVDLLTGTVHRVGPFNSPDPGIRATNIQAMELAPSAAAVHGFSPGALYGISMDGLGTCNPSCFFRIDKYTATITPIAGLSLNQGRGLSFDPVTGELWVFDSGGKNLYTLSPSGQLTWRAQVQSSNQQLHTGVDTMFSLAHSCDGRLFGVDIAYGVLVEIDPATGQAWWVGDYGSVASGGSFNVQGLDGPAASCTP